MVITVDIVRPDDLLNLHIEAINLVLETDEHNNPILTVQEPLQPAYLIVIFPPQTIAEGAYFESSEVPAANEGSKRLDPDSGSAKIDDELDMPGQLDKSGVAKPESRFPPRRTNAQIGHPSRLVFNVPAEAQIPFSVSGLLDWSNFELNLNPIAAIGKDPTPEKISSAPGIRQPTPEETAIEIPYRLVISPNREARWGHRIGLFTSHGRTELWHTRLTLKTPNGRSPTELSQDNPARLRAIWSPDYKPVRDPGDPDKKDEYLARTAMSPDDRNQIVVLTSAFSGYEVELDIPIFFSSDAIPTTDFAGWHSFKRTFPYVPEPFNVELLMLSPLGGWLRSLGHWEPPRPASQTRHQKPDFRKLFEPLALVDDAHRNVVNASIRNVHNESLLFLGLPKQGSLDLSEWAHVATQGRDHYVRIVYEGELWPFRHHASLIKVTERKFKENNGIVGAYLMQKMFIVVREPEKIFNNLGNPLRRVRLTTLVTPDIIDLGPIKGTSRSFWVEVKISATPFHELFKFHAIGTDVSGKNIDFTIPLMFVSKSDLPEEKPDAASAVAIEYNSNSNIERRNADLFGQKVMFAEQKKTELFEEKNDNTQLVTKTMNFVVDQGGNPPQMFKAEVKIPQVQELLGTDALTKIRYFKDYVSKGFDEITEVFAEVVKEDPSIFKPDDPSKLIADTLQVNFSADKAGGFATPSMGVSTLTRKLGPLAGKVEDALTDKFMPDEFFKGMTAQLFGTFDLFKLVESTTLTQNAPKLSMQTEEIDGVKYIKARLDWEPAVHNLDLGIAAFTKDYGDAKTHLSIHGTVQRPLDQAGSAAASEEPKSEFTGTMDNFSISVLKSVDINFAEFSFKTRSGQKPDVTVRLVQEEEEASPPKHPIEFKGDLKFVDELRKAIPPNLFGKGSGPSIDLLQDPLGIRAGFAFALPPLAVGVFALKDVGLGAALTLPFLDGKPVFDFNISEREHPFLLTVGLFGGGGFFKLQLDTAGMKEIQAALEFGAAAAINIGGLASGEVHIMAGIYFSLQRKEDSTELAAVLSGYLRMGGSLSVLGLIRISIEFNLSFTYDSGRDKAYGRATLTVEVEVAFFSKSIELTVERAFGGKGDPGFGDLFEKPEVWSDYATAFAGDGR